MTHPRAISNAHAKARRWVAVLDAAIEAGGMQRDPAELADELAKLTPEQWNGLAKLAGLTVPKTSLRLIVETYRERARNPGAADDYSWIDELPAEAS